MNFKFDDIKRVKEIRIKSKLAKLIPTIKTEDNPNNDKCIMIQYLLINNCKKKGGNPCLIVAIA